MKTLDGSDVYTYKNYYKLNAKITTTKKVTNAEAQSVINNVKTALYTNFNAREVDYGYEIPFDSILNVIQNADARIKNVSLDEPELVTKVMLTNTVEDEVDYELGQTYESVYDNLRLRVGRSIAEEGKKIDDYIKSRKVKND